MRAAAAKWVADTTVQLELARAALAALPLTASAEDRNSANSVVEQATENAAVALEWQQTTLAATEGNILFMDNCARCHTRGWSYFDPADPKANPAPGPMGGGAFGPNLTEGDVDQQFPSPLDDAELLRLDLRRRARVTRRYGTRGISSGRMPHFGAVLTKEQIEPIMAYERSL